jgi:hypothetical protein
MRSATHPARRPTARAALLIGLLLGLVGATAPGGPAQAAEVPKVEPAVRTGEKAPLDAALIIGNEAYGHLPQATWAGLDARAFREWALTSRGMSGSRVAYAEDIDRRTMLKLVEKAGKRVGKRGTMWIYFAGHGAVGGGGERVLVGVDAEPGTVDQGSVSLSELSAAALKNKSVSRVVFVLDAGFGSLGRDGLEVVPGAKAKAPTAWAGEDPRVLIWAADRGDGQAQALEGARHGLFTWSVLGALRGWADGELDGTRDGRVTMAEAQAYTARVPGLLGRAGQPTLDLSPAAQSWTLVTGGALEQAPPRSTFEALAAADRLARVAAAEKRLRDDAEAFWADTLSRVQQGGPGANDALQAYINEFAGARLSLTWSIDLPRVQEAQRLLAGVATAPAAASGGGAGPDRAVPPAAKCDDLIDLEGKALLGELGAALIGCVEGRIATDRLQTNKNKLSRLLIANAENAGKPEEWERLMQRHLEDIERSDPDLCMRYAVHLHKQGLESEEEALRWSAYALENKQRWQGDDYVKRVNGLLRLRAEASNKLWRDAEERYSKEPTPEHDKATRQWRGEAMTSAREWLDYARASGGKTDQALLLCQTAAGTNEYCKAAP